MLTFNALFMETKSIFGNPIFTIIFLLKMSKVHSLNKKNLKNEQNFAIIKGQLQLLKGMAKLSLFFTFF